MYTRELRRGPVVIAGIYFLLGYVWILFSDRMLLTLVEDHAQFVRFQTYKGWVYVLITAVLAFVAVRAHGRRLNRLMQTVIMQREELERALVEREQLLRELHHRVKNNLQFILSLVRLSIPDDRSRTPHVETLERISDRVYTIAAVHELAVGTDVPATIECDAYFRDILNYAATQYAGASIHTRVDLAACSVSIEAAVPLGLVVNELLTNAYRHAFRNREGGEVRLTIRPAEGGLRIEVVDNGAGGAAEAAGGFGLAVVRSMSNQVHAHYELCSGPQGTAVVVDVPSYHLRGAAAVN